MKTIISVIILIIAVLGIYLLLKAKTAQTIPMTNINETVPGLKINIIKEGGGQAAENGDLVSVNYTGTFENGEKFDSNVDPKFGHLQPFQFTLGQGMVIKGWDLGVLGMKAGEKRTLIISPELGYGDRAIGPIPPNSTLIFEVELLSIK